MKVTILSMDNKEISFNEKIIKSRNTRQIGTEKRVITLSVGGTSYDINDIELSKIFSALFPNYGNTLNI